MNKILFICILVLATILRLFNLSQNPPSLNWDEASLGYNAYTILTSAKDEHGEFLPLARFIAYGDFKPPGYIYAIVPSIFIFGLNEFTIRFPSVISGIFLVIAAYLTTKELFGHKKLSLVTAFLVAISLWSVHFSRVAFEANMAATLNAYGIYFFLRARKQRGISLVLSFIFFILSFYTFNANRIIAPLLLGALSIVFLRDILKLWKWFFVAIILSLLMILPSISYLQSRESKVRFQEVSIFNNLDTLKTSNSRIEREGKSLIAKIIHNRRVLYAKDYLKHLADNLNFRFIFTHGDANPRLSIEGMGLLYVYELPFLILGLFALIQKEKKVACLIGLWMLIVMIPAGTAKETPHALRIASILPTYQILTAFGMIAFLEWLKRRDTSLANIGLKTILAVVVSLHMFYFLHIYMIHYPRNWAGQWQYGYKEMVEYVLKNKDRYSKIYVTSSYGRPYIYFALYKPYSFDEFSQTKDASRNWFGFWTVHGLGNIRFDIPQDTKLEKNILIVESGSSEIPPSLTKLKQITLPNGEIVFQIAEKQ